MCTSVVPNNSAPVERLMPTHDCGRQLLPLCGPYERLRRGIVVLDVGVDRLFEFGDIAECAAADPFGDGLAEESLH